MTNTEIKRTQKDMYAEILNILDEYENVDHLVEFVNKKIEQIDKKAATAKTKAAEKKAKSDELQDVIESTLTDEFATLAEIQSQIDFNDEVVSTQKISSRLKNLVDAGVAEKSEVKVPGGEGQKSRKVMAYRLAQEA